MVYYFNTITDQISPLFSPCSTLLLYLPFDANQIDANVDGQQSLVFGQAHFQELLPGKLFHRLVF